MTVLISAHSGHGGDVAHPGYEAYRQVLDTGAEYAELDIRKTGDNVLVACHDARTEAGGRLLAELSYGEVCAHLGYEVPKVAEVMSMLAGKFIGHLDLKETGYEAEVVELALATFGAGNFVVTTLEDISVRRVKEEFPDVRARAVAGPRPGGCAPVALGGAAGQRAVPAAPHPGLRSGLGGRPPPAGPARCAPGLPAVLGGGHGLDRGLGPADRPVPA